MCIRDSVKAVHIQRSRGYSLRPSLPVSVIGDVIAAVRAVREDVVVFVDNCYGEFAERLEPCLLYTSISRRVCL